MLQAEFTNTKYNVEIRFHDNRCGHSLLALGYEDINDHVQLRHEPFLALMAGRKGIIGQDRVDERSIGVPLAGKSTFNRLELTPIGANKNSRYKKIIASIATLLDVFIRLAQQAGFP